jgi:hypothetical protein
MRTMSHLRLATAGAGVTRTDIFNARHCGQNGAFSRNQSSGFTAEMERQAWDDEGREEDRQKALSGASEGDGLAFDSLEASRSAGVSTTANLQGVTARFDRYLDRVVHVERPNTLPVNRDVVCATSDLDSDCFVRHLQCCCHRRSPMFTGRATTPLSSPQTVSARRRPNARHRG